MTRERQRTLRPTYPLDLNGTLRPLRRGVEDPTMRLGKTWAWRATRTPAGPCAIRLEVGGGEIGVSAWGPGAEWAVDRAPELVGLHDDPHAFHPVHPRLRELHRRHAGLRIGRSSAVVEALLPSILEQRVSGMQARRSYHRIVRAYSEPAPGPEPLLLPPDPAVLARLAYYDLHPFAVERKRAITIIRACRVAARLERASEVALPDAYRLLQSIPGIGAWTAAEVAFVALGDPDAVSVGDLHLPHMVAWALAGEPRADDARMLELLEPYLGQRGRAIRLLERAHITAPRRGPRRELMRIERL